MSEQISNVTYQQALERLNELVAQIEDPKMPVEQILGMVKESTALIQFCRNSLRETQQEIANALNE